MLSPRSEKSEKGEFGKAVLERGILLHMKDALYREMIILKTRYYINSN